MNLILGKNSATVSDSAIGCTFKFSKYAGPDGYMLYDTVGLSEGSQGTMASAAAMKQLVNLLKSLSDGVSLLIMVIKKERITASLEKNYQLFVSGICLGKVPVLLVITNCEMEQKVGAWWSQNKIYFDKYKMYFAEAISGCAADPDSVPARFRSDFTESRAETKAKLMRSMNSNALREPWKMTGGWMNWFQKIVMTVWSVICSWFGAKVSMDPEIKTILMNNGMKEDEATQLADEIWHVINK